MGTVTFIERDGTAQSVDYRDGESLMQAGTRAGIDGIIGECGGSCMCATCHVYVEETAFLRLPPPEETEKEALEFTAVHVRPLSRLGCQLRLGPTTDGMTFTVAGA